MTIEQVVVERLLAISSVTALVGTRVYQLILPQHPTLPAIRVQQISERSEYHLRGLVRNSPTRIQVDAYGAEANGYSVVTTLADAIDGNWQGAGVPNGLSGWRGMDGGSPPSIEVTLIHRVDRRPEFEAEELRLVRVRQDYMVHWRHL